MDNGQTPGLDVLETTLISTPHGFTSVYFVLNALDECPFDGEQRIKLLGSIRRIHNAASENLHLLYTSRPENDITKALRPTAGLFHIDLGLHKKDAEYDIRLYIDERSIQTTTKTG